MASLLLGAKEKVRWSFYINRVGDCCCCVAVAICPDSQLSSSSRSQGTTSLINRMFQELLEERGWSERWNHEDFDKNQRTRVGEPRTRSSVLSGKFFKPEEVDSIWRTPWEIRPKFGILSPNKTVIKEGFGSSNCCALPLENRHHMSPRTHSVAGWWPIKVQA